LPTGAALLARTDACPNQAFAIGPNMLALQFHPEADATRGIERWLIGHAVEIAQARIDPVDLRRQAEQHGQALKAAARTMLAEWLGALQVGYRWRAVSENIP
jgi:GMP synthase (glutamine-hydrolysing)